MNYNDVVFLTGVGHPNSFTRAQGAYRLAHVLRSNGYKTRVIDGVGSLTPAQIISMIELTVSRHTKLFCISSTFFTNLETTIHSDTLVTSDFLPYNYDSWMNIIKAVKKLSNAKIIVGGHKTSEFEKNKHQHTYIDYFVYGYGDEIILKLIRDNNVTILKNNSTLISSNQFSNLGTRYDLLDSFLPGESFTIEMQRGCRFRCAFCAYPLNGKQKGSFMRDIKDLVDELEFCNTSFNSINFIINSDTFNDDNRYLENFYNELSKRNLKFNFGVNARIDLFYRNNSMIDLCKEIGIRSILFGLETSNPFSLKEVGKSLKFEKVVDTLHRCREVWKDQVRMTGSYIIGLPEDTEENIKKVEDFFTSNDCPLHGIEFDPLYVQNLELDKNPWKSKYTMNPEKYGFTFEKESLTNWENPRSPYKNFQNCVLRAEELLTNLHKEKKGTIKSAAYIHLPNNYPITNMSPADKFETIFKFNTYNDYRAHLKSLGKSLNQIKDETAIRYFELFMKNNGQ